MYRKAEISCSHAFQYTDLWSKESVPTTPSRFPNQRNKFDWGLGCVWRTILVQFDNPWVFGMWYWKDKIFDHLTIWHPIQPTQRKILFILNGHYLYMYTKFTRTNYLCMLSICISSTSVMLSMCVQITPVCWACPHHALAYAEHALAKLNCIQEFAC